MAPFRHVVPVLACALDSDPQSSSSLVSIQSTMKVFAVLSLVSAALAANIFERDCSGNNCNRAITGTRAGLPATTLRQSDCSSFMLTVVTPSPVTSTTWIDGTTKSAASAVKASAAVTAIPSILPTYATQCSSVAAYSSACSCWGITARVSTAATPTVTVTSTYDYCDL